MGKRSLNKRAQLTLFIILGVLILVGIIAFFMILPKPELIGTSTLKDPMQDIKPCIADSLRKVLPEFLEKGFYFEPSNSVVYQNKKVSYHCYTSERRKICIRNDAQSKSRIENELKNKISNDVEKCFDKFKNNNPDFDIQMGQTDLSLEILPEKIIIKTRKNIVISKSGEQPVNYNYFDVSINSPIWDFIFLSNEIINEEVSCDCPRESCTANLVKMMDNNRDYKMIVYIGSRSEKVYTIENFITEEKFNFAIKNCDRTL